MVAVIVLLPATVPVKVAVYVPLSWSVTALKVPLAPVALASLNTTVNPPEVSLSPLASSACSVMVVVPPIEMLAGESVMVDFETLTAAPVAEIGARSATGEPPMVALISLVLSAVPVKVAL